MRKLIVAFVIAVALVGCGANNSAPAPTGASEGAAGSCGSF